MTTTEEQSLLVKYRPKTFDEVVGHVSQVKALKKAVETRASHAFLFTGPSGVGKTTLARIAAAGVGCDSPQEIDAATYSGAEDARAVTANLMYKPMGGSARAIIVDEVQALSKQAFQALLKSMEEPPAWVYWFLCTTEAGKVPAAIKTRCVTIDLKPIVSTKLTELVEQVAEAESIELAAGVAQVCGKQAEGSPRQALANLALCREAKGPKEAARLLEAEVKQAEGIELARLLMGGRADWGDICELLERVKGADPEGMRHVVRAYATKVAMNPKDDPQLESALAVLDCFSTPFLRTEGVSPLVLACGRLMVG